MAKVRLNLSISNPTKFKDALKHALAAGLNVEQAFEDLGVVSGTIDSNHVEKLRKVDGIDSVEPDREVKIKSPQRS